MPLSFRLAAAVCIVALFSCFAQGGTTRSDVGDSQYLALATLPEYQSVGRIDGTNPSSGFIASGTLIAPDWVLTAAHVVDDAKSMTFSIDGSRYSASSWTPYPTWIGDAFAGNDIGLVHLSSAVKGVQPAIRYAGSSELNSVGTALGYGMTGNGLTGSKNLDGNKRAVQNVVDDLFTPSLMLSDFDSPLGSSLNSMGGSQPLPLEGMIAPGDSGGGMFIDVGSNTYLAGVNSFVGSYKGKPNSGYGNIAGETRVSAFNEWIDSVIGADSSLAFAASDSSPCCMADDSSPVPEPSTLLMLIATGPGLILVLRKATKQSRSV
jgi:hypothetical protein